MEKIPQNQYLAPSVRLIPLPPARAIASSFEDGGEGLKFSSDPYEDEEEYPEEYYDN